MTTIGSDIPSRRGWYIDPVVPRLDRWWDGQGWTDTTAPRLLSSGVGLQLERSMRTGPNTAARNGLVFAFFGLGVQLLVRWAEAIGALAGGAIVTGSVAVGVLGVAATVWGMIGLVRTKRWGGGWPSGLATFLGLVLSVWFAAFVASMIALAPAVGE